MIPVNIITRPPTAELRENQTDQDSLPPYDVLDAILERLVEREEPLASIVAEGFDREVVARIDRLLNIAEYKRRQAAPGVKVTRKNFGRDRRYPITNRFRDAGKPLPEPDHTLVSRAGRGLGGGVRRVERSKHVHEISVAGMKVGPTERIGLSPGGAGDVGWCVRRCVGGGRVRAVAVVAGGGAPFLAPAGAGFGAAAAPSSWRSPR